MPESQTRLEGLISTAADFYRRDWMVGTSGNLSIKLGSDPLSIAITGSGASKGELTLADIAVVPDETRRRYPWAADCRAKPSAETAIHQVIYTSLPTVGAIYHVHTVASTALSLAALAATEGAACIEVNDLEMVKGWGVDWEGPTLTARIPVLPNRRSMEAIAEEFARTLTGGLTVPLIIIAGHGLTVWGETPAQARNRLEVAEFICQVLWQQHLARPR